MRIASQDNDVLIIEAAGGTTEASGNAFIGEVFGKINDGVRKIVVDCSQVDLLASFELGLLVQVHTRAKLKKGEVKFCAVKPIVREVFEITAMDKIFDIQPDLDSALAAF